MRLLLTRRPLACPGALGALLTLGVAIFAGMVLIWLPPLQALIFVGLLAVLVGAVIEPFVGLAAALFLGPFKAYLSVEVPGIPAQIAHLFLVLAFASWLAQRLTHRDVPVGQSPLLVPLLVFVGAALLSLWNAGGLVTSGVLELAKWVQIVLVYVFVSQHITVESGRHPPNAASVRGARRLRWLVVALLGVGLFQAGVGIWQFGFRGTGPEHFAILDGAFSRAYGTFEQPNPYAGFLGLTAALALGIVADGMWARLMNWHAGLAAEDSTAERSDDVPASRPAGPLLSLFAAGAGLAMLVALAASWSRGAWIGFGAATLVMAGALPRKARGGVLLMGVLAIGGAGLYTSGLLPASFTARLTSFVQDIQFTDVRGVPISDANYAVVERLAHWQAALSMFRSNVWIGVGFGCYEAAYRAFALINWPMALGHAHNYYLNLMAETGLIGVLAYGSLWGVILWQTWCVTRCARGLTRGLSVGLLGAWTHIGVHHLLDNLYVNNVHLQIGVLFGMLAFSIQQTSEAPVLYDR